jgi:phage gpG-like protein
MFDVQIRVVDLKPDAIIEASRRVMRRPLRKIAYAIRDEIRASMIKVPALVGRRGGLIQIPSPPGTPPHEQSGTLKKSIRVALFEESYYIGTDVEYGKVHEFGGRHHPPRPFLNPAKKYSRIVQEGLNDGTINGQAFGRTLNFLDGRRIL